MVLVHGWGVSGASFDAQVEALSPHHRLVIPDLPSHGRSAPFPAHGRFSLLADSLAALIDSLNLERPVVVGWSLGAMVCWDLALRHERLGLAGLVSVEMMPRVLASGEWRYGLGEAWMSEFNISLEAMRADWPAFCASFVPGIFAAANEARLRETIDRTRRIAEGNDAGGLIRIWQQLLAQDFREALGRLALPTMIICGAASRLWEEGAAQWLAAHVPNQRFEIFDQSGHSPQLEEPERFNRALLDFAAQSHGYGNKAPSDPVDTGGVLK